ncbi:hypothetical protein BpHYR1_020740, partial [Brachionus plicatilis]
MKQKKKKALEHLEFLINKINNSQFPNYFKIIVPASKFYLVMNQDTDNESNDESVSECEVRTETKNQTIGKLVKRSNFLGQMVSISTFNNRAFESLPFTNYNEFAEKFTKTNLNINVNLFTENKCIFIPDVPIKVEVQAHRKTGHHFFNQFNYAIKLTHGNYIWKVKREYKELREVHKILSKIAKKDLGKSCSEIE